MWYTSRDIMRACPEDINQLRRTATLSGGADCPKRGHPGGQRRSNGNERPNKWPPPRKAKPTEEGALDPPWKHREAELRTANRQYENADRKPVKIVSSSPAGTASLQRSLDTGNVRIVVFRGPCKGTPYTFHALTLSTARSQFCFSRKRKEKTHR